MQQLDPIDISPKYVDIFEFFKYIRRTCRSKRQVGATS